MNTDATPVKPVDTISESFALWVEVVTNIAAFFAEHAEELQDWKLAGPPCSSLVQLFPAYGELRDNTDIAKRAALAIGGTWVRERESYGESWRGNVALADGYTFQICLHYVIRRPFGSGVQIDLSADAATAAAKEVVA